MTTISPMTESEIQAQLTGLTEWKHEGNSITRTIKFPSFIRAIEFVNAVAHLAERHDHHPDIAIHYQQVLLKYWTHTAKGVTPLDFEGAKEVESMIHTYQKDALHAKD